MEHYILEGVTDALFLNNRTTTSNEDKNIADVIPRGVYIRLRSVLRGLSPLAHFTDIYIPCVGVYSVCFLYGCGRPEYRTGKCRHHVFYV